MTVEDMQQLMKSFQQYGLSEFYYSHEGEILELRVGGTAADAAAGTAQLFPAASAVNAGGMLGAPVGGGAQLVYGGAASQPTVLQPGVSQQAGVLQPGASLQEASPSEPTNAAQAEPESAGVSVLAELAGVFYRAPQPGEKPYTEVGEHVKEGQTVGLIEAMKMMSEIPAPCDGVVREILVGDAEFAAYHTPLLVIEPESGASHV